MKTDQITDLTILHQDTGRFDKRFVIGPACWPHFDLLWLHEGAISLKIGSPSVTVDIQAPMGVLIFPDVPFQGVACGAFAAASVCHFTQQPFSTETDGPSFVLPDLKDAFHIQNLIRLSLEYKDRRAVMEVRTRLLRVILDCFRETDVKPGNAGRMDQAWSFAARRLANIRGLSDVATSVGLSESAFRALHRQQYPGSAGRHLQELRLRTAEQLLATTGQSLKEISDAVGYAHPESFSAAFTRSRKQTPGAFRRWCKRLA